MATILCQGQQAVFRDIAPDAAIAGNEYIVNESLEICNAIWFNGLDPRPYRPVAMARSQAVVAINQAAGTSRAKFITVIPGQEMTYAEKEREALAYLANPSPVPADYPMLVAEATATGVTLPELAAEVVQVAEDWRLVGSEIEGIRRGAIVAVQQATTTAEVDAVTWHFPSPPVRDA
jgi:hypothetical protein